MTDRVGKGWFSMPCYRPELIGSGIRPPTLWHLPLRQHVMAAHPQLAPDAVRGRFHAMIDARIKEGGLDEEIGSTLKERYDAHVKGITYLV